ncbi:MAG: glucose-6-phosphate isomerase [Acidimicrobiia bacterium]
MIVSVSVKDPGALQETVDRWQRDQIIDRLWDRDATVWTDPIKPEVENRLGWLELPVSSAPLVQTAGALASTASSEGIKDIVLCGMGGSSLAPEVFASVLPRERNQPSLTVLDTTHPDAIAAVSDQIDPRRAWYLIASKSGGTLETMSLFRHFWAQSSSVIDDPGQHFVAITDPGSSLSRLAEDRGFRSTVLADPTVGGRFAALTAFGLVPSALVGGDVGELLASASSAMAQCAPAVELYENPGFVIGSSMALAAINGNDKAYFDCSSPVSALGVWIEQLIAESTGKDSTGIIPIDGGPRPSTDGASFTVSIGLQADAGADATMSVTEPTDVGGAMYILEFATAVAGEILGIHPFDQPDVQLAKSLAARAMDGDLPETGPKALSADDPVLPNRLHESLGASRPSYVAIQAYMAPNPATDEALARLRKKTTRISDAFTTVGYGPRFLHSTGQLHKGGPPDGVYIQITDTPTNTIPIAETDYSFNELIAAQAAGDRAALADRGRTVIPIHTSDLAGVVELIGRSAAE